MPSCACRCPQRPEQGDTGCSVLLSVGAGDLNSGPHDWTANALISEPPGQPNREITFLLFLFSY